MHQALDLLWSLIVIMTILLFTATAAYVKDENGQNIGLIDRSFATVPISNQIGFLHANVLKTLNSKNSFLSHLERKLPSVDVKESQNSFPSTRNDDKERKISSESVYDDPVMKEISTISDIGIKQRFARSTYCCYKRDASTFSFVWVLIGVAIIAFLIGCGCCCGVHAGCCDEKTTSEIHSDIIRTERYKTERKNYHRYLNREQSAFNLNISNNSMSINVFPTTSQATTSKKQVLPRYLPTYTSYRPQGSFSPPPPYKP